MSEGKPKDIGREIQTAALEGNVRMPQTYRGIALFAAEQALSADNFKEAVESLVQPIEEDEYLRERTKKANAQHRLHEIGKVLNEEDVKSIQNDGNYKTLEMLGDLLDVGESLPFLSEAPSSKRLLKKQVERVVSAWEELSQEEKVFLQQTLTVAVNALRSPEGRELSNKYRSAWRGVDTEVMSAIDLGVRGTKARTLREELFELTRAALEESIAGRVLTPGQGRIFTRVMGLVD